MAVLFSIWMCAKEMVNGFVNSHWILDQCQFIWHWMNRKRVYPFDDTLNRFIKHSSSNMLICVFRSCFCCCWNSRPFHVSYKCRCKVYQKKTKHNKVLELITIVCIQALIIAIVHRWIDQTFLLMNRPFFAVVIAGICWISTCIVTVKSFLFGYLTVPKRIACSVGEVQASSEFINQHIRVSRISTAMCQTVTTKPKQMHF